MKRVQLPTLILLAVWLLTGAGLAWLWLDRQWQPKNVHWHKPQPVTAVITPVALQEPVGLGAPPQHYAPILERPLLALDRRPPPPPAPPPPPPPPDALAGARLFGLMAGEQGAVLLRAEGRMRTLQPEQQVGNWTLKSIAERSATFERPGESRTLQLDYTRLSQSTQTSPGKVPPRGTSRLPF